MIKKISIALIVVLSLHTANAQLTVSGTMTATQLVQNVLIGSGVTVSNVTYTGAAASKGSFNGSASNIGLASGVLLSTGTINKAVGPNNSGGTSTYGNMNKPGDPDLDIIINDPSVSTFDAAILEFDFVPLSDTIKFKYVFGSEEYMEFVNSGTNDAFGFFISGPGISGPFSNNSKNIALIPGTTTPVTIDNVNAGLNSQYYIDNENPPGTSVQYDGFTVPLTAESAVICGQQYHIKLVIGDASDGVWDSGVFLEAGSFTSHGVSIVPNLPYGGTNDSVLYEGCGTVCIDFVRTSNIANADTVNISLSGAAQNGVDYYVGNTPGTLFPAYLYFAPGVDSLQVCVTASADGTAEGLESMIITVVPKASGLCVPPGSTGKLYINEHSPLTLTTSNDTTICVGTGAITLHANANGGVPPYSYSWSNGLTATSSPTANPPATHTYTVSVNDACFGSPDPTPTVVDSVKVTVLNFPNIQVGIFPKISNYGSNNAFLFENCGQACIDFVRTSSLAAADTLTVTIAGTATNGSDYYYGTAGTLLPTQLIFPIGVDSVKRCINATSDALAEGTETINLSITQSNACVNSTVTGTIGIKDIFPITVQSSNDTTFCSNTGGTIILHTSVNGGLPPYTYSWTNGAASTANPTVNVSATTTYIVTVNDVCAGTPDPTPAAKDTTTITVLNFNQLVLNAGNDEVVCAGNTVNLKATQTGGGAPFIYNWSTISGTDTVSSSSTLATSIVANTTGVYQISVVDICNNTVNDNVTITVEASCALSIPNIITPDGRGPAINETFYIDNLDRFPGSSLEIYNRWGKKIYGTANYTNDWAAGKNIDGTYFYMLTVPKAGSEVASLKKGSNADIKVTTSGDKTIFAGYFQISKMK
jgi:hypothetical protein